MIIQSLLDNDFYKFTMIQGYYKLGIDTVVAEYKFVDRNNTFYTQEQFQRIKDEIQQLEILSFTESELNYLKSLDVFSIDFINNRLRYFKLPVAQTATIKYNNGYPDIRFKGPLAEVSMFEIYVMAIISEIMGEYENNVDFKLGQKKLEEQITNIEENATTYKKNGFKLVDFGTRRRFSQKWQTHVIHYLKYSPIFAGTSNVELSRQIGKKPVGTMAHEWFQVHQGFYEIKESQLKALENWEKIYPNGTLGVALTDIFNMEIFSKDFVKNTRFADVYKGLRHDSGDPMEWANKALNLFKETSSTLDDKTLVFSDGLDLDSALGIQERLEDNNGELPINVVFGIGTKLTNNVGAKAPNIVIKNIMTNNSPTVKISDEPGKTICEDEQFIGKVMEEMESWR